MLPAGPTNSDLPPADSSLSICSSIGSARFSKGCDCSNKRDGETLNNNEGLNGMPPAKEAQVRHLRLGDPAEIRVDAVPGAIFPSKVDHLASASGTQFPLLPPGLSEIAVMGTKATGE